MSAIALDRWRERATAEEIAGWLAAGESVTVVRPRVEDFAPAIAAVRDDLRARGVDHHGLLSGGLAVGEAQLHFVTGDEALHFRTDRLVGDWLLCKSTGALLGIERPSHA